MAKTNKTNTNKGNDTIDKMNFNIILSTFAAEEKTREQVKIEREKIVAWGRLKGYKIDGILYHFSAFVPNWPLKDDGSRVPFGSIFLKSDAEFRSQIEFKALNAFSSWLKYNYASDLMEKVANQSFKKIISAEIGMLDTLEMSKEEVLHAAKSFDITLPEMKKIKSGKKEVSVPIAADELQSIFKAKLEEKEEELKKADKPIQKLYRQFDTIYKALENKRTLPDLEKAQVLAKITDILSIIRASEKF